MTGSSAAVISTLRHAQWVTLAAGPVGAAVAALLPPLTGMHWWWGLAIGGGLALVVGAAASALAWRAVGRLRRDLLKPLAELNSAIHRIVIDTGSGSVSAGRNWWPDLRSTAAGINDLVLRIDEARRHTEEVTESIRRRDVVAVQAAELAREEERKGQTDALTGVFNRRRLDIDLAAVHERMERTAGRYAYVMVDVDHFKQYNDSLGHQRGDELLAGLGQLLRSLLREGDSAYRYGGEEFALILPGSTAAAAMAAAERIRTAVAERLSSDDRAVSASFGVAAWPDHGTEPHEVVRAADAALYVAKEGGRNRVVMAERGEALSQA